jgi:tRNA (uracil-5-)-methyltransferase
MSEQSSSLNLCVSNDPFNLSYVTFDPNTYENQLQSKVNNVLNIMNNNILIGIDKIPMEIFPSPSQNYRYRSRFAVECNEDGELCYAMYEHGKACVRIIQYPIASDIINMLMTPLMNYVNLSSTLKCGIKAIHFLSTLYSEAIIVLIYEQPINQSWIDESTLLQSHLIDMFPDIKAISIICRSKKIKFVIGSSSVKEILKLQNGSELVYMQVEDGFSNPNPIVNAKALSWICNVMSEINTILSLRDIESSLSSMNMLELYCGNGNHTVALASNKTIEYMYICSITTYVIRT